MVEMNNYEIIFERRKAVDVVLIANLKEDYLNKAHIIKKSSNLNMRYRVAERSLFQIEFVFFF